MPKVWYIYRMKRTQKAIPSPFLKNKAALQKATGSLRTSFAIEGVLFSDAEIEAMVQKVLKKKAVKA